MKKQRGTDSLRMAAGVLLITSIVAWFVCHFFLSAGIYIDTLKIPEDNLWPRLGCRLLELLPAIAILLCPFLFIKKLKHAIVASFAVAIAVALFCLLAKDSYFFNRFQNPYNNRKFNREIWLSHCDPLEGFNPRGLMARDLLNGHLKLGMKKSDVILILGSPSRKAERTLWYTLGIYSGIFDNDFLKIDFNDEGLLMSAKIIQG
jgi:hypothetical protein